MYPEVNQLKIFPYVDPNYDDLRANNLNFKFHLRGDKALSKKTIYLATGRPLKSEYYIDNILMAVIYFIIPVDGDNLMTGRREELQYIKNDGEFTDVIVIKDKEIDPLDLGDGVLVMDETVKARKRIVKSLKAFLAGFLKQAIPANLDYVKDITEPFWDEFDLQIRSFQGRGTNRWHDDMLVADLSAYDLWMTKLIQPNVTVKDYIISKLTY